MMIKKKFKLFRFDDCQALKYVFLCQAIYSDLCVLLEFGIYNDKIIKFDIN